MWTYYGDGWAISDDGKGRAFDRNTVVIAEWPDGTVDVLEAYWMPVGTKFMFE